MKNILIIKCGETPPKIKIQYGDYEDWIIKNSGLPAGNFRIANLPAGDQLRHPSDYAATIITDSQFHINQRFEWIQLLKNWLLTAKYSNSAVLGMGFGLHAIIDAFGGKIALNGNGQFAGTSFINILPEFQNNPLFGITGTCFESYLLYNRYVEKVPAGSETLAMSTSGIPMIVKTNKIVGIQFRPEIDNTLFKSYLKHLKLPARSFLGVRLSNEHKSYSFLSNYLSIAPTL